MTEFEFILEDRIAKIKSINEQYDLEHNAYLSFSGGKDSVIVHYLLDMALPGNSIPRIFANTGIEYLDMVAFVKSFNDPRIVILNQKRNIRVTLREYGYPFKSKEFASRVEQFNKGTNAKYLKKYLDPNTHSKFTCPQILRYIFTIRGKYNYSNRCCYKLKKDLVHSYTKGKYRVCITGMRNSEGGNRSRLSCLTNNGTMFHPIIVVDDKWEQEFIEKFNIQLCKLYYPPYNFTRTGCKGCPFNLTLQHDLLVMKKLLPNEYKQCLSLWKPVYDEYVRLGYRLDTDFYNKVVQYSIDDFLGSSNE